jgi:hypothetical protein
MSAVSEARQMARQKARHEATHKAHSAAEIRHRREFAGFLKSTKTWEFADWVHEHHDEDDFIEYSLFALAQVLRKALPNMTLWEFQKIVTEDVGWDKEKSFRMRGGFSDYVSGQFSLMRDYML